MLFLLLIPFFSKAQVYPFDEGFHGVVSGTLPSGWSGDMKVQADHGLNDLKGMTADIGGNDALDSAITPWVGPLDNSTEFYFWYRIVDQFIYPSTEKHLNGKDLFTISYSTDSVTYTTLYTIDSSNHQSSLNFKKVIFPITNLGGQVVKFKFWAKHGGGGSYFFDVDSIKVRESTGTGVSGLEPDNLVAVYPNPCPNGTNVLLQIIGNKPEEFVLMDINGKMIYKKEIIGSGELLMPTSDLAAGMYFIRYGTLVRKLVVE